MKALSFLRTIILGAVIHCFAASPVLMAHPNNDALMKITAQHIKRSKDKHVSVGQMPDSPFFHAIRLTKENFRNLWSLQAFSSIKIRGKGISSHRYLTLLHHTWPIFNGYGSIHFYKDGKRISDKEAYHFFEGKFTFDHKTPLEDLLPYTITFTPLFSHDGSHGFKNELYYARVGAVLYNLALLLHEEGITLVNSKDESESLHLSDDIFSEGATVISDIKAHQ